MKAQVLNKGVLSQKSSVYPREQDKVEVFHPLCINLTLIIVLCELSDHGLQSLHNPQLIFHMIDFAKKQESFMRYTIVVPFSKFFKR